MQHYQELLDEAQKCVMCAAEQDSWEHKAECKLSLRWAQRWVEEAEGRRPLIHELKKAMSLEKPEMTELQVELHSKLRCSWYDMWRVGANCELKIPNVRFSLKIPLFF